MEDIKPDVGQLKFLCEAGQFLAANGRFTEACDMFQGVIALSPKRSIGYTLLGDAYLNWGKYDEALKTHQIAVEMDPGSTFARVYLAQALLFKKQKDKALAELKVVLEKDPNGSDGALARSLIRATELVVFKKV
jgi:tetratricopeptide (TPR) repeat protein